MRNKTYLKSRIESFNRSLDPTANWGLEIVYQNGFISVYRIEMNEHNEIVSRQHQLSGKARDIDFFIDGLVFLKRNLK